MSSQLLNAIHQMDSLISKEFIEFIEGEKANLDGLKTSTPPDTSYAGKEIEKEKSSIEIQPNINIKTIDLLDMKFKDKPSIILELDSTLVDFIINNHPIIILKPLKHEKPTYTDDQLQNATKDIIDGKITPQDVTDKLGIPR